MSRRAALVFYGFVVVCAAVANGCSAHRPQRAIAMVPIDSDVATAEPVVRAPVASRPTVVAAEFAPSSEGAQDPSKALDRR